MAETLFLRFEGLNALVAICDCPELIDAINTILPKWRYCQVLPSGNEHICAGIEKTEEGKFLFRTADPHSKPITWNAVNAICQLLVELAWEQLRSQHHLLCLHAAAIELNGKLILFPNGRRAGKSTLAAALVFQGARLLSDDFVLVDRNPEGGLYARGNGVLPRVRLPLPNDISEHLKTWLDQRSRAENAQYRFFSVDKLAGRSDWHKVGGIVLLERNDDHAVPKLRPADQSEMIEALLKQNFARAIHSGDTLAGIGELVETVPIHVLEYRSASEAATFLKTAKTGLGVDDKDRRNREAVTTRQYDFGLTHTPQEFDPLKTYCRAPELTEINLSGEAYLSDTSGKAVHRLNAGSTAIWRLLEQPITFFEIVEVMSIAYPDIDHQRIEADVTQALQAFLRSELVHIFEAKQKGEK